MEVDIEYRLEILKMNVDGLVSRTIYLVNVYILSFSSFIKNLSLTFIFYPYD